MTDETKNALVEAFGGSENMPVAFSPAALMASSARMPKSSDKPYLTFKDGEWTYGAEAAECDPASLWAVNPNSYMFGLIEWLDSVAGGEVLVPAGQPYSASDLVLKFDSDDDNHRIAPQIAADFYCINGDDEGLQVCFKTSTRGGVDALNNLAQQIAKQANTDPDNVVAVVRLDGSSYMHKKYKRKTYVPIVKLLHFDNFDLTKTRAMLAAEDAKGAKKPKGKPQTVASDGVEAPPARRRRRAS